MSTTFKVGPLTRVEGHLDIQVTVDTVNGVQQVVGAKCSGTMFRGFESILKGRDPRDAVHLTARICGVCPISHAMAASLAMEAAFKVSAADNGRIVRNLVLGANFLQSHVLHFYHLAAPDYINTTGLLDMSPWTPRFVTPDMLTGSTASKLVNNYLAALDIRRKAHQLGAIFGGKMPASPVFVPGGSTNTTNTITAAAVSQFKTLLTEIQTFINTVYLPDVNALAAAFPQYATMGKGCGNLLAYGVFDLDATGSSKLLKRGRYSGGGYGTVDPAQIVEYTFYSYYATSDGYRNPSIGTTNPLPGKAGAYSWIKAPRYTIAAHEVGPLARMWVNGDYRKGISVLDREAARALEAQKVAAAMMNWVGQLQIGAPLYNPSSIPAAATGIGLTEAPRGALGHWLGISGGKVGSYQIVTPTAWNASPKDDRGVIGPIEKALVGTPVKDLAQPIEVLRVVHSFDPCLSCAVHAARPGEKVKKIIPDAGI